MLSTLEWFKAWWAWQRAEEEQGHPWYFVVPQDFTCNLWCYCSSQTHKNVFETILQLHSFQECVKGDMLADLPTSWPIGSRLKTPSPVLEFLPFLCFTTSTGPFCFVSKLWVLGSAPINLEWNLEVSATSIWKRNSFAFSIWFDSIKYLWFLWHLQAPSLPSILSVKH